MSGGAPCPVPRPNLHLHLHPPPLLPPPSPLLPLIPQPPPIPATGKGVFTEGRKEGGRRGLNAIPRLPGSSGSPLVGTRRHSSIPVSDFVLRLRTQIGEATEFMPAHFFSTFFFDGTITQFAHMVSFARSLYVISPFFKRPQSSLPSSSFFD